MSEGDGGDRLVTMLRYLGSGHDPQNFPGTPAEKLGLIRTARARGLVAWSKVRGRYVLTRIGWREAMPRRGFGLASLAVSTAIGAVIGAGALAVLWLPADASHPVGRQLPAPMSRSVDPRGGLRMPKVFTNQVPSSQHDTPMEPAQVAPKLQTDPVPTTQPDTPMEPARVAEQPVPAQPSATATPTGAEPAAVKKPRHKTAKVQTYRRTWAGANNLYRDERYVR